MLTVAPGAPFHLRHGWFDSWSAAFGAVEDVGGVMVVRDALAIGPVRWPRLRSATNPHSIRFDISPDVAVDDDLPRRLLRAASGGAVQIDYLEEEARLLAAARGWSRRHRVAIRAHALSPVTDCRAGYSAWLAARSKRIRQRLRIGHAALVEARGMRFEVRRDVGPELLTQLFAVERSGWKGRAGTAIADDTATATFYTLLAARAAAAGALRVALLWDGARLVAFEFGILCGRRLALMKVGYDESLADFSPGYVLAGLHIAAACADPAIDWYDKLGNGLTPAPYKLRFADGCDTLYRVTLYPRGPVGAAWATADHLRARAKAWRDARKAAA
ncbi:GNAT family N-acetyltransferase [Sphingomonas adhaesiva]|uniref:GNAT family N-acetyltransferase n=1 Tax=Sphingomonas adhaesiva TaxID=28212 RepID=UPI002FF74638